MQCGMAWRREWQPTPVFLSGESLGQRSLVGYSPWGHKEWDTTEATWHALLMLLLLLSRFSRVPLFVTPWTVAHQPPLSMGFPSKNIGVGFPDKNTGVGCHALLQGIFPTQGSNPSLLRLQHWRQILYH